MENIERERETEKEKKKTLKIGYEPKKENITKTKQMVSEIHYTPIFRDSPICVGRIL